MKKTLCFTGPRPQNMGFQKKAVSKNGREYLVNISKENSYEEFICDLVKILENFYDNGYSRFITGGARGFDQLAFWAVNELKKRHSDVQNILYLPFKGQERLWPDFGYFGKQKYNDMLVLADEINYVCHDELTDYSKIIAALYNRNHAMVTASDKVLALYDSDDWQTNKGGTCECIRYAVAHQKPVVQLTYHVENEILCADSLQYVNILPEMENDYENIL